MANPTEEKTPINLEYKQHVIHPEGVYAATVNVFEGRSSDFGPRILWELSTGVKDDQGEELPPLYFWTSQSISSKSKLGQFLTDLGLTLPRSKAEAQSFDLRQAKGKLCQVVVEHVQRDDTTWANVARVIPQPIQQPA